MNPTSDHELRTRFSAQRNADHELAPAWNPRLIEGVPDAPVTHLPRWLPITAMAACLLLGVPLLFRGEAPDLVEELPVLFETTAEPLFANLDYPATYPSDFLLPTNLTIQLP